ncbi:GDP-fucose transporter 1 [Hypsizygus marmoreus]|uniref:GDP-fucose transporter 1 n=1 Tax=Hypsizygus marmoreus TaxID=39966 RepID=A0A369KB05_HYPMA|nr:GDP-fucose transporter 1 [Hypsizygus marmoreus]
MSVVNPITLQVAGVVSFYMCAALVMVFVNKAVLNNSPDLPLLFLLLQLLIAVTLLHASAVLSKKIEIPKFDVTVAKKLVPVVLVNIIGLVFNTLCLRDVEASFFQIARGLVLPLTILVSSVHTRTTPPQKVLLAAVVVTTGFFIGIAPSNSLPTASKPSLLSLFYGVLSSLFIALHAVLIKSSLPHCNNSTIQLAWWTNFGSALFLFPAVILHGEVSLIMNHVQGRNWDGTVFFWGSMVTGLFGFLLCIAGLLSIKITSPITHMFSSAARSVLQTLLGVWIFKDILTVSRGISILVILGGTMFYTWIKAAHIPPPSTPRAEDVESARAEGVPLTAKDNDSETQDTPPRYKEEK